MIKTAVNPLTATHQKLQKKQLEMRGQICQKNCAIFELSHSLYTVVLAGHLQCVR